MKGTVTVLGAGSWGTALAQAAAQAKNQVRLWDRKREFLLRLAETHENKKYHPGIRLNPAIRPEPDLKKALASSELLIMGVPSHAFREILERAKPSLEPQTVIVNAAKGLDGSSLKTLSYVAREILGEKESRRRYAVLSGPSFAQEVMKDLPTALTVAAFDPAVSSKVQDAMHSSRFHVFSSDDVVGVEIAGALKNVIAIAAGAVDEFGYGHNSRAGLITRGLAEIARIGKAMGANPLTFSGLAGLGDLLLTCTGDLSRNRRVGMKLAQGKSLRTIMREIGQCAEGIRTARSAYLLAKELKVDAPILKEMYLCVYERKPPQKAIEDLLSLPPTAERD